MEITLLEITCPCTCDRSWTRSGSTGLFVHLHAPYHTALITIGPWLFKNVIFIRIIDVSWFLKQGGHLLPAPRWGLPLCSILCCWPALFSRDAPCRRDYNTQLALFCFVCQTLKSKSGHFLNLWAFGGFAREWEQLTNSLSPLTTSHSPFLSPSAPLVQSKVERGSWDVEQSRSLVLCRAPVNGYRALLRSGKWENIPILQMRQLRALETLCLAQSLAAGRVETHLDPRPHDSTSGNLPAVP